MELILIIACHCLYWVFPVSCAKEHDDSAARQNSGIDPAAERHHKSCRCM